MSPRRTDPKSKQPARSGLPTWVIALGIGILIIVGVVVLFTLQTSLTPATGGSVSSTTAASRTKGNPNAKIELIDYSDFQ